MAKSLMIRIFVQSTTLGSIISGFGIFLPEATIYHIILAIILTEAIETTLGLWILPRLRRSLTKRFHHVLKLLGR